MGRYLTKAAYARCAGVSRAAIQQAVNEGRLVLGNTGKLDVKQPTNAEYLADKRKGQTAKQDPKPKKTKTCAKPAKQTPEPTIDVSDLPQDLETLSHASANKLKTIEQIRQYQVKTDEMRKKLVPRETVRSVFSKLHMVDVNQWRTLGPSVAPDIAALIGADDDETILEISNLIEVEVFKILGQCKRLLNDYLENVKSEPI